MGNVPAQPLLAVFEVVGRRAPAQEGDLAAIHFGHVAELPADEGIALEIAVFFHDFAENPAFRSIARGERTEADMVEKMLFGDDGNAEAGVGHAPFCRDGREMFSDFDLQLNPQ